MRRLEAAELGRLGRFLAEVEPVDDEAFPRSFLAGLRRLVPCDDVCFSELDRVRERDLGFLCEPEYDGPWPDVTYWDIRHLHPICSSHDATGDFRAARISDFVGSAELQGSRVYAEWFQPQGVEHQLTVGLDAPLDHTKVFLFSRSVGPDFTERDCAVLDAIRPLLRERWELALAHRRLDDVMQLLEGDERAIVVPDGPGHWTLANDRARELLERLGCAEGELPEAVTAWLDTGANGVLNVSAGSVTIAVCRVGEAVLLEELGPGSVLTRREREILDLVAEGKTNGQIAEQLWISGGTVRRHLENAYAKLGVHTRTAAVRAVSRDR